jgi:hypothetical protein
MEDRKVKQVLSGVGIKGKEEEHGGCTLYMHRKREQ